MYMILRQARQQSEQTEQLSPIQYRITAWSVLSTPSQNQLTSSSQTAASYLPVQMSALPRGAHIQMIMM